MKVYFTISFFLLIGLMGFSQTGNVGIGNTTPVAKLDIAGDLALREGTAIAVSGANPAVVLTLHATNAENSFYRISGSPTGTMTLNSIANGVDGQLITLVNATTIKLKITNTNSANGILTAGALTQVISPNGSVTIQYSATAGRWFITSAVGSTLVDWIKATTADEPAISTDNQYITGNAGIGDFSVNTPQNYLHIKQPGVTSAITNNYAPGITLSANKSNGTSAGSGFYLENIAATSGTRVAKLVNQIFNGSNNGTLTLQSVSDNAGALVNGGIFSADLGTGNVGIGTIAPYTKLDVQGDIYTTVHGNNDLHNTAEIGSRYIGMKSGNTSDGFTGMKTEVGQFGSNGSGAFTNNGSRITFQTWGNSIAVSRDVMTINEFGEIFGKFRESTVHNARISSYYACSGSWPCDRFVWFPAPGDAGDDNEDNHTYQENIFIAPYAGRIVAIYLSTDNSSSNSGWEIQQARFIFNKTSGTMPEDGSSTANSTTSGTYTQLASGSGTSFSGGRFWMNEGSRIVWKEARGKSTFSFGQGDQVAIGVSGSYIEDNDYQMTVVWEYNIQD